MYRRQELGPVWRRNNIRAISLLFAAIIIALPLAHLANANETPLSEATQECINCHATYSPGIVEDWRSSRHASTTPAAGLAKPELERRVSSESIPENLAEVAVGCYECHGLNPDAHPDNFDHFGYAINIIVSPTDCATCHSDEAAQFAGTKKAHAVANLRDNPTYHSLVDNTVSIKEFRDGHLAAREATFNAWRETCYGCHGTPVEVVGTRTLETDFGEMEVPLLNGWPNQGVGRENPDGSVGACSACHPRHSFDIAIARQPHTCSQCHLVPDLPAWNVYRESKHGNIYHSVRTEYDWDQVPWTVGTDFRAPTCATCHNALLVSPENDVIVERSHDFGARLWVRIFGLIYSHPQPDTGATYLIENADGQPLPTTFDGAFATEFLISQEEQQARRTTMKTVCTACHGPSWADGFFAKLDTTLVETDSMVATATRMMQAAWNDGLADPANPFDETLEHKWIKQWLFYANSVRYGSAMSGPDYATFKNGWWDLTRTVAGMDHTLEILKAHK